MDVSGLAVERRIEVLWDVPVRGRKRSLWWGAVVRRVVRPLTDEGNPSAILLYDPMLGHKSSHAEVRFLSENFLETVEPERGTVRLKWRWGNYCDSENTQSTCAGCATFDSECARGDEVEILEVVEKETVLMQGITPEQYEDLVSRVEALEKTERRNSISQHKDTYAFPY
jgi:hypothetical protein